MCTIGRSIGHNGAMRSSNPALNEKVFQREIEKSRSESSLSPAWGSPADEMPSDLFGQRSSAPRGGSASTLPPPPPVERHRPQSNAPYPSAPESTGPFSNDPFSTTTGAPPIADSDTMRLGGTMSATAILFGFLLVAGYVGWQAVDVVTSTGIDGSHQLDHVSFPPWLYGGLVIGFILAIGTVFKPKVARITGPLYALAKGAFVGAITHVFEGMFPGIALQAVGLTLAVFTIMLVLYATGTIKVTNKLRTGIMVATGAIAVVYLISWGMRVFAGSHMPMIHESSTMGIAFSFLVVGIAAFNLLLDFDFIERGVQARAPKYMEWFAAFGLMITLVWLYLELLRLLAKLRD